MGKEKKVFLFSEFSENYGHRLATYLQSNASQIEIENNIFYTMAPICENHGYRHSYLAKNLIKSYFHSSLNSNSEHHETILDEIFNTYILKTVDEIQSSTQKVSILIIPAFFLIDKKNIDTLKNKLDEHFDVHLILSIQNIFDSIENLFVQHFSGMRPPVFYDFNDFVIWLKQINLFTNIKYSLSLFKDSLSIIDTDLLSSNGDNFLEKVLQILGLNTKKVSSNSLEKFKQVKTYAHKIHPIFKYFIKNLHDKKYSQEEKLKLISFIDNFTQNILKINKGSISYYQDISVENFDRISEIYYFIQDFISFKYFKQSLPICIQSKSMGIINHYYE